MSKMAVGGFTTTNSSQQLMNADAESVTASGSVMSIDGDIGDDDKRPSSRNSHQYEGLSSITYSEWFAVGVLCFVNLINYMDRFTIAGKLIFFYWQKIISKTLNSLHTHSLTHSHNNHHIYSQFINVIFCIKNEQ